MIEEIVIQSNLGPELFEKVFNATSEAFYKKGALLLEQGEVCRNIYIIEKGLLRMFYFDKKGNDISHWFAAENELMSAPRSFFERTESVYLIEALEDSKVRRMELDTLNKLCDEHHTFEHFGRLLTLRMLMELNKKLMDLQFKTAKERYLSLLNAHPDIFQRVNLGHIASYIGITIQSLSRIRADLSQS